MLGLVLLILLPRRGAVCRAPIVWCGGSSSWSDASK